MMYVGQTELYRRIYSDDNLWQAWRAVKANKGQPGQDGVSISMFEQRLLANLKDVQARFAKRSYRPGAPMVFDLKKPDGGKRPIAVMSMADRVAERAIYQAVNEVVDPDLHASSHAFRPGRSTATALAQLVDMAGTDAHWFGHVDIKACFPSLGHWHLKRQIRRFVKERDVRKLVYGFMDHAREHGDDPNRGVLQGGPLSPMLSNMYLDTFDRHLDGLEVRFVRYADNVLFVAEDEPQTKETLRLVRKALRRVSLKVKPEKTVLTHLSRDVAVLGHLLQESEEDARLLTYQDLHAHDADGPPQLDLAEPELLAPLADAAA